MKYSPKRLFLLDASGAFLTAFLLGVLLVRFEPYFGMPRRILYGLSLLAGVFMVYSFACYCWVANHWRPFLKGIALANLAYCCLTFGLVWYYYPQLTALGVGYFLLEIAVIVAVVWIEWGATRARAAQ